MTSRKKFSLGVLVVAVTVTSFWKCSHLPFKDNRQIEVDSPTSEEDSQTTRRADFHEKVKGFYENADADISFYGRVIDQNGHGIADASVRYQLQRVGVVMPDGKIANNNEKDSTSSSGNGSFSVKGRKGLVLTILGIDKVGYRYVGRNANSFGYRGAPNPHKADAASPVDFLLVSEAIPKTKKLYHDFPRFSWNQGPVEIEIPNLGVVTLLPTREKKADQIRGFDWHITVSIDKATMVPIGMGDAPIAPEIGYKKSFEYGAGGEDKQWTGAVRERYAFKSQSGFFGVIDLDIVPDRSDGTQQGSLEVRINESGSRNLDR
jgi:hypothetical protein